MLSVAQVFELAELLSRRPVGNVRKLGSGDIVPALRTHLDAFVEERPDAFAFLGAGGGFLRGSNFRREAGWHQALTEMGLKNLHFHDLRHTGNTLAAGAGRALRTSRRGWGRTATGPR